MYNSKNWYQSKTVWGIVLAALIAVAQMLGVTPEVIPGWLEDFLQLLAMGLAIYGRFNAKTTLK
jgi:hypothetical protein